MLEEGGGLLVHFTGSKVYGLVSLTVEMSEWCFRNGFYIEKLILDSAKLDAKGDQLFLGRPDVRTQFAIYLRAPPPTNSLPRGIR